MAGIKLKLNLKPPKQSSNHDDGPADKEVPKLKIKPPKPHEEPKRKKLKINIKDPNSGGANTIIIDGAKKKKPPKVRIKPTRTPGEGYDSETPDMEDDPLIEQGIVVRFLDDSNLDTVHNAVESNDLSGINIEWIGKNKAIVRIYESVYSARLVDLPTVSEIYKTVDKKNIFKVIDICEILLIIKLINPRDFGDGDFDIPKEKLYHHPLYKYSPNHEIRKSKDVLIDGLTNPFQNVYRRFKPKKLGHRVMDDIDAKVDELIKLDEESIESHFEVIDPRQQANTTTTRFASPSPPPSQPLRPSAPPPPVSQSPAPSPYHEVIDQDGLDLNGSDNDLENELAEALGTDGEEMSIDADTPAFDDDGGSGDAASESGEEEDEEDEEDDDDEDDDDDDDEDEAPDSKSENQHVKLLQEEIADLEKAVENHRKGLEAATQKMMRMKFQNNYNMLKASLDAKRREFAKLTEASTGPNSQPSAMGANDDDDDDDEDEEDEGNTNIATNDEEAGIDDLDDLF